EVVLPVSNDSLSHEFGSLVVEQEKTVSVGHLVVLHGAERAVRDDLLPQLRSERNTDELLEVFHHRHEILLHVLVDD
ncbi:hypothetical protein PENTCL1PPCAC_8360, partial [Pristionchus entomophagus]